MHVNVNVRRAFEQGGRELQDPEIAACCGDASRGPPSLNIGAPLRPAPFHLPHLLGVPDNKTTSGERRGRNTGEKEASFGPEALSIPSYRSACCVCLCLAAVFQKRESAFPLSPGVTAVKQEVLRACQSTTLRILSHILHALFRCEQRRPPVRGCCSQRLPTGGEECRGRRTMPLC